MSQDLWEDYQTLGQQAPLYRSAVARRPKQALVLGPLMPWVGIAGYYFPFSAEPVVGPTVPTHTAYNIAHELAHSLGVAPEDEAGFSAYLACMESEDPLIQYLSLIHIFGRRCVRRSAGAAFQRIGRALAAALGAGGKRKPSSA